jgi:hypothetical protein
VRFEVFMAVRMMIINVWVLVPLFWMNILPPSSALNMGTVCFSEMLSTDKSTQHQNLEKHHKNLSATVKIKKMLLK